jgi:hypothetical protein
MISQSSISSLSRRAGAVVLIVGTLAGCSANPAQNLADMREQRVSERIGMHAWSPWYIKEAKRKSDDCFKSGFIGSNAPMTSSAAPAVESRTDDSSEVKPRVTSDIESVRKAYICDKQIFLSPSQLVVADAKSVDLIVVDENLLCADTKKLAEGLLSRVPRCIESKEDRAAGVQKPKSALEECVNRWKQGRGTANLIGVIDGQFCIYIAMVENLPDSNARVHLTNINRDALLIYLFDKDLKSSLVDRDAEEDIKTTPGVIVGGPRPEFKIPPVSIPASGQGGGAESRAAPRVARNTGR